MLSNFNLEVSVQIRYSDIDSMNHVNNAIYLTYLETARVAYFNKVLNSLMDWKSIGIILARTEIDYILPLFLNDIPRVQIAVTELKNKSFIMEYSVVTGIELDKIHAYAKTILVFYDYSKNESILIPEEIRNRIKAFEKL